MNKITANQRKHHSQTNIKFTNDDPNRLENAFFPDHAEISENELESQASTAKLPSHNGNLQQGEPEDEAIPNPFEDYEPKNLQGRENLSYTSNMNTPRSLAMTSPINVQQQRRFEKRNIPVTFSNIQDKFNKYNIKAPEDSDENSFTPVAEGRARRDPLSRSKFRII